MKKLLITKNGRECSDCHDFKSYDFFYKKARSTTGYQSVCKSCMKERHRKKNAERTANRESVGVNMHPLMYDFLVTRIHLA